jgi:transposase-like protein
MLIGSHAPRTFQEAAEYFSDPDVCLAEVVRLRWPDGVVRCPNCGSANVSFLKSRRLWDCEGAHPGRQFSARVGTVMEASRVSLGKWLIAMWLIANTNSGLSSHELARTIGVTQKSAWFMLHRIRLAVSDDARERASA